MESLQSPLNLAHIESRRADRLEKSNKYDEAIESHKNAMEFLQKAERLTDDVNVIECMKHQKDNHSRQIDLLKHRKEVAEYISKNQHKRNKFDVNSSSFYSDQQAHRFENGHDFDYHNLNSLVDGDSLLQFLYRKTQSGKNILTEDLVRNTESVKPQSDTNCDLTFDLNFQSEQKLPVSDENQHMNTTATEQSQTAIDRFYSGKTQSYVPYGFSSSEASTRSYKTETSGIETESSGLTEQESELEEDEEFFLNDSLELAPLEIPQFDFSKHASLTK